MPFPIEITFRGMQPSEKLRRDVESWAEKLETAFDGILRCDVVVEAPHHHQRRGREHRVRITLSVPGDTIVVSHDPGPDETHEDVHVAVRDAFHAARRRLEDWVRRDLRHRRDERDEADHGRVSYLDVEGAWGYLDAADGHRVYFHRNAVVGGDRGLAIGDEVRFTEERGDAGPQASSVVPLGAHGHHELPR
jgi:cold shock CspA family protein/ribosome-associated translation inhibitor RaiA